MPGARGCVRDTRVFGASDVLADKQARGRGSGSEHAACGNSSSRNAIHWVGADMEQDGGTFKVKPHIGLLRCKIFHAGILDKQ